MLSGRIDQPQSEVVGDIISIKEFIGILFARWKFIISVSLAAGFMALLISILIPNQYTATSTILPTLNDTGMNSLFSLEDKLPGIDLSTLGLSDKSPSILYPEIMKSRQVCEQILTKVHTFDMGNKRLIQNLYQYFKTPIRDDAILKLFKHVSIVNDRKTRIISVSVTTKSPELSAQVANDLVEKLDEFNKSQRKAGAGKNREFIENRLAESKIKLADSEANLKKFRENNLNYYNTTDPELTLINDRLMREVELKSQVYLALSQQYEMAAIQEKKDIAIIRVLDNAVPPNRESGPNRANNALIGLFMGFCLSVVWIIFEQRSKAENSIFGSNSPFGRLRFIRPRIKNDIHVEEHAEHH